MTSNEESINEFEETIYQLETLIKENNNKIEKLQRLNELYNKLYIDNVINLHKQSDWENIFSDYKHENENTMNKTKEKIDSIIHDNISEDAKNIIIVQVDQDKSYNIIFDLYNRKFYLIIPIITSYDNEDYDNVLDYGKYCLGIYLNDQETIISKSYNMKEIKKALEKYIILFGLRDSYNILRQFNTIKE